MKPGIATLGLLVWIIYSSTSQNWVWLLVAVHFHPWRNVSCHSPVLHCARSNTRFIPMCFCGDWEQMNPCCCQLECLQWEQQVWSAPGQPDWLPDVGDGGAAQPGSCFSFNSGHLSNGIDSLQKGKRNSKHWKWAIVRYKPKEDSWNYWEVPDAEVKLKLE